jgi:predicted ATPase
MIHEITINRFKSIQEVTLALQRINILIGSNNSGKSSILQAVQFSVSAAQTLKQLNQPWNNEETRQSFAPSQLIYAPLREIAALAPNQNFTEYQHSAIQTTFSETVSKLIAPDQAPVDVETRTTVKVVRGRGINIQCSIVGSELGRKLQPVSQPFSVFVPGLAGIPQFEEVKSAVTVRRAAARGDANNVFRNVLWLLKQNKLQWAQFLADFTRVFPDRSIDVSYNTEKDEHITANIISKTNTLPIDAAGTGILQAIQILAYINLSQPKLLILDEPDAHLHPNNQRRLANVLIDLAEQRDFQILLSTHSRHLLDELKLDAKIHWIRDSKRVPDTDYSDVEVLLEVGALDKGDLLKSGAIKCVVLTEDDDISVIEALIESSSFKMSETEIWPYKGCSKLDTAIALIGFIATHAPATKVIVHRDRDYLATQEAIDYEAAIKKAQPHALVFLTPGTDAESCFLNADHFKHIESKFDTQALAQIIEQATIDTKDQSITTFINSRAATDAARLRKENKQVNVGELAIECRKLYDADIGRYRHGKKVMRRVRHLVQNGLKLNPNPFKVSHHIADSTLKNYAAQIWPVAGNTPTIPTSAAPAS